MITPSTSEKCYELRGTHDDFVEAKENPEWLKQIGNGTVFFEMDTGDVYMYNESEHTWVLL